MAKKICLHLGSGKWKTEKMSKVCYPSNNRQFIIVLLPTIIKRITKKLNFEGLNKRKGQKMHEKLAYSSAKLKNSCVKKTSNEQQIVS